MSKRFLMVIITICLIIALTACGSNGSVNNKTDKSDKNNSQTNDSRAEEDEGIEGTYVLVGFQNSSTDMLGFEEWLIHIAEHCIEYDDWTENAGAFYRTDEEIEEAHIKELTSYENRKNLLKGAISMYSDEKLIVGSSQVTVTSPYLSGGEFICSYVIGDKWQEGASQGYELTVSYEDSDTDAIGYYNETDGMIYLSFNDSMGLLYSKHYTDIQFDDSPDNVYGTYRLSDEGSLMKYMHESGGEQAEAAEALLKGSVMITINKDGSCELRFGTGDEEAVMEGTYNPDGRTAIVDNNGRDIEVYYFGGRIYMEADAGSAFIFKK